MKSSLVDGLLGYLKFGYDFDGIDFSLSTEETLRKILEGDEDPSTVIATYIEEKGLSVPYDPSYPELGFYPGTRCLVNYFNIKDKHELKQIEILFSSIRIAELFTKPLDMGLTFSYLKAIHQHIVGDLYPSAGMIREKSLEKKSEFCKAEYIETQAGEIFSKLSQMKFLSGIDDFDDFINELAYFMGEIEALHPFQDGNGRTTRFFFSDLARRAGYDIIWNTVDVDKYLEANIASIDGDYQPLFSVLEESVIKRKDSE